MLGKGFARFCGSFDEKSMRSLCTDCMFCGRATELPFIEMIYSCMFLAVV